MTSNLERIIRYSAFVLAAEGNKWRTTSQLAGKLNTVFDAEFSISAIAYGLRSPSAAQYFALRQARPREYSLKQDFYAVLSRAILDGVRPRFDGYQLAEVVRWLGVRDHKYKLRKVWRAAMAIYGATHT